jgi:Icc-related predicted phosphoesterase
MILISDVHGAAEALRRIGRSGGPLLVLGDLINFIDYRDCSGILADVVGRHFVEELVRLRTTGDFGAASALWGQHAEGREDELRTTFDGHVVAAYTEVCAALEGVEAYVTYGNVDRPDLLQSMLPAPARFVDAEVIEIDGWRVGFAGGGMRALGTPGEVSEDEMAAKLASLGEVDVLCTHVPPAIPALAKDVVGGRQKSFQAILDYVTAVQPAFHYFGDIHQPQAVSWRVGRTVCRNVGYFRATGRGLVHDAEMPASDVAPLP